MLPDTGCPKRCISPTSCQVPGRGINLGAPEGRPPLLPSCWHVRSTEADPPAWRPPCSASQRSACLASRPMWKWIQISTLKGYRTVAGKGGLGDVRATSRTPDVGESLQAHLLNCSPWRSTSGCGPPAQTFCGPQPNCLSIFKRSLPQQHKRQGFLRFYSFPVVRLVSFSAGQKQQPFPGVGGCKM